jgi:hypothetical protein
MMLSLPTECLIDNSLFVIFISLNGPQFCDGLTVAFPDPLSVVLQKFKKESACGQKLLNR